MQDVVIVSINDLEDVLGLCARTESVAVLAHINWVCRFWKLYNWGAMLLVWRNLRLCEGREQLPGRFLHYCWITSRKKTASHAFN